MQHGQGKLWYLRRLNLFAGMSPEEVETIADQLRERTCRRRETLLDPTAPGDRIFLIKRGAVRVYHLSPDGRELTSAILRPGQLLGTSSLVGVGEHDAFAEAMEETYLCEATAEEFVRLMSGHPLLAAKVTVALARQLLRLERQLEQLAFQEVPARLAQALLQLADDNGGQLPNQLTHAELATLVATTRETVTKALSDFVAAGLVEVGYRHLAILDPTGLQRIADVEEGVQTSDIVRRS